MVYIEYKTVSAGEELTEEKLNKYGDEGWILCGIGLTKYVFQRIRPHKTKGCVVIDTRTGEVMNFKSLLKAAEHFHTSSAALRYAITHRTEYMKRFKVEDASDETE